MGKQEIRERIWDELDATGEARFPYPPHDRIPNFAGAETAAERLVDQPVWNEATTVKSNPDSPQLPVRRAALRNGKTLYVAVPRLREEACFLRVDPAEVEDTDAAATIGGATANGVPVRPEDVEPIDLVVSGSVAVTESGVRIGKGEGYSDLEFAILHEFDRVDEATPVWTTVHEIQLLDDVPSSPHDVPIDQVHTPERSLTTESPRGKPAGIDWDELSERKREEIPILERLWQSS